MDRWRSKDRSETKETFTIVTTQPSKFAAHFNNRMPVILGPGAWDLWLKGEPNAAAALMKPANEDVLVSRPVNKAVGNVKNNGPELWLPCERHRFFPGNALPNQQLTALGWLTSFVPVCDEDRCLDGEHSR